MHSTEGMDSNRKEKVKKSRVINHRYPYVSFSPQMAKVVNFYKGLPNGPAPAARSSGYQARYFDGKNSSMTPVFQTIAVVFALSYTIDYHFHLSKSFVFIGRSGCILFFLPKETDFRECCCCQSDETIVRDIRTNDVDLTGKLIVISDFDNTTLFEEEGSAWLNESTLVDTVD